MIALAQVKLPLLLKAASASSATSVSAAKPPGHPQLPSGWRMESDFFEVHFDLDSGRFGVWRKGSHKLLFEAIASAVVGKTRRSTSEKEYARAVKFSRFQDESGSGRQLVAQCIDSRHELDFEIRVCIYDEREMVVVEALGKNVSKEAFTFDRIELAYSEERNRTAKSTRGNSGTSGTRKTLEPGQVASSGKMVFDFGPSSLPREIECGADLALAAGA